MTSSAPAVSGASNAQEQTSSFTVGSTTTSMSYAGPGQSERTQKGSDTFVHDLLGVNRRTVGTTTTYFTRTPEGTVIGQRTGSTRNYFLLDGLNSVVAVTGPKPDGTIDVLASYAYDPYGNTTSPEPEGGSSPFRYANYLYDSETQLYKVGMRYYDSSVGRWSQRDAIDNPLDERGWNRYVYAGNDPINFTDPTGLKGCSYFAPDRLPLGWDFRRACNEHDQCYSARSRTDREDCDSQLARSMLRSCFRGVIPVQCVGHVLVISTFVLVGGSTKYDGRGSAW